MVPFNLQIELNERLVTFSAEQLDQLVDNVGFMRYQIRIFNHYSLIYVNIDNDPLEPGDVIGFSEDDTFSLDEVKVIAAAIRDYNRSHQLNFGQMPFEF
jgi:hypothetical protein